MQANERARCERRREPLPLREGKPERRDVGAERVIGLDRPGDHVRTRRFDARIDDLAPIAPRPAVEGARSDRRQVIGHEIAANLVALVDDGVQHAAARRKGKTVGFRSPEA